MCNVYHLYESISSCAQYATRCKKTFTSKFQLCYSCTTPPIKLKLVCTTNRWGTSNSKPPGQIIMMGQSETLSSNQIIFITLFPASVQRCCAVQKPRQCAQFRKAKTNFLSQTGMCWMFTVQDHIRSTVGDAPIPFPLYHCALNYDEKKCVTKH